MIMKGNVDALNIVLVSAAALVDCDGRVLLAQRPKDKPMGGLWEFPGGKLQIGETPENALIRELREELNIDVSNNCLSPITFTSYSYKEFHLILMLYVCRIWDGEIRCLEGQDILWLKPSRMSRVCMPPADKPLVTVLRDLI